MTRPQHSKNLLLEIADRCLLFMSEGSAGPYAAAMGREEYESMLRAKARTAEKRRIQRLQQKKLIKIYQQGDRISLFLTKQGTCVALREYIIRETALLPVPYSCLVTFDVPERTREARDLFRKFLKQAKFKRVHQSVWITNRNVTRPIQLLIKEMNISDWIQIYLVRHLNI